MSLRSLRGARLCAVALVICAAVLAPAAAADSQLLPNGTFEGSGSGSLAGWAPESATLALTGGRTGSYAALVRASGASAFGMHASPNPVHGATAAGTTYSAGGWVRSDAPGRQVCLRLIELSKSGATLGKSQQCLVASSSWTQLPATSYTATASGGSLRLRVYQTSGTSGSSFAVDDLTLAAGATDGGGGGGGGGGTDAGTFTIVAAGDIGCDPKSSSFNGGNGTATACQQKWTGATAQSVHPDAVLPLGDLAYDCAGAAELAGGYAPFWGAMDSIAHPAAGNHEYQATSPADHDCTPDGSAYFDYWGARAGDRSKGYYSWDIGAWHMIALNANCSKVSCSAGSPQVTWLQQDLARTTQPCILAYWHQPLFTAKGIGTSGVKPFWNALYAAGADVVLNGHVHVYERFTKMSPSGAADPHGMREFIVGTGGSDHGGFGSTVPSTDEAHSGSTFGVLQMQLAPSGYSWQFLPDGHSGSFKDSGSASCN